MIESMDKNEKKIDITITELNEIANILKVMLPLIIKTSKYIYGVMNRLKANGYPVPNEEEYNKVSKIIENLPDLV